LVKRVIIASCVLAGLAASACAPAPEPQAEPSRHVRNRFFLREDAAVTKDEPAPHDGGGNSTAYRYFDDVPDARLIFRKRALHKGAAIGMHVLTHDEVYYVVSGRGRLRVDDRQEDVGPNTAVFMHAGADVGIWQQGEEDLVVIVAYPPAPAP
jgi:mannose-6-phosphate isomerase-like protein (cupin superfamily)